MIRINPSKVIMCLVFSMIIVLSTAFILRAASIPDPLSSKYDRHERISNVRRQQDIKVLNKFVFELLTAKLPTHNLFSFKNPRDGWIFVKISGKHTSPVPTVKINNQEYQLRLGGKYLETLGYLSMGRYTIKVSGKIKVRSLIVHAVPELFYNMYRAGPQVPETGNYSWNWLCKHVLDHYNSIIGTNNPEKQEKKIKQWIEGGGRWYTQSGIPQGHTAEAAYDYWTKQPGMTHPLLHGIWADEFVPGDNSEKYSIWCDALRRMKSESRFKDRKVYAYKGITYNRGYDPLIKTIMENDFRPAPEWYLPEQPGEEELWAYINLKNEEMNRAALDAAVPGAAENRVIVLGLFSQPEESYDIHPHINYNVLLDMQVQAMANDPAFLGTRGLQGYYSPYTGEEQTRLFARLIRHYAIEGHKHRMLKDPYILTHLKNPDFTEGISEWLLSAAA